VGATAVFVIFLKPSFEKLSVGAKKTLLACGELCKRDIFESQIERKLSFTLFASFESTRPDGSDKLLNCDWIWK
jgi:hypothetical protein